MDAPMGAPMGAPMDAPSGIQDAAAEVGHGLGVGIENVGRAVLGEGQQPVNLGCGLGQLRHDGQGRRGGFGEWDLLHQVVVPVEGRRH